MPLRSSEAAAISLAHLLSDFLSDEVRPDAFAQASYAHNKLQMGGSLADPRQQEPRKLDQGQREPRTTAYAVRVYDSRIRL